MLVSSGMGSVVDYRTAKPWEDVDSYPQPDAHYPGEGVLVYPGDAVGVQGTVPSIRQVATDFQNWSDDPAAIERARRMMGEALSRH